MKYAQLKNEGAPDSGAGGMIAMVVCCVCGCYLPLVVTIIFAWVYMWTREIPLLKACDGATHMAWVVAFIRWLVFFVLWLIVLTVKGKALKSAKISRARKAETVGRCLGLVNACIAIYVI
jgi:hypothetical protein